MTLWTEISYYVDTGTIIVFSGDPSIIGPGDTLIHNDWESDNIGMRYCDQSKYYVEMA